MTATPRPTADAVNEAARTVAEASRRTVEGAQAAAQYTRTYMDESAAAGRRLFSAWVAGTEAMLAATFDLQNVALSAGISLIDTTMTSNRSVTQQWTGIAQQAQRATMDAFAANVRMVEKLTLGGAPIEAAQK